MQRMKDKSLPPDEKQKVIADMKSTGAQLKSKLDATAKTELTAVPIPIGSIRASFNPFEPSR